MMRLLPLLCVAVGAIQSFAQDFQPVWSASRLSEIESFDSSEKIAGTHYFYWYDYPDHHFFDNASRSDDALQDHFTDPQTVSYRDVAWHQGELSDCIDAGLDFIMPVYWGAPDNYFKPDISFSVEGLGPLQLALKRLGEEGEDAPKVGLFYDTSTLLPGVRGEANASGKYDLREETGRDIFYRTIRDFFYQIDPRHWAAINGRPIVTLYGAGFVSGHDAELFDYVNERFQRDFHGLTPFIIRDFSWTQQNADAVTRWGAALDGPYIFDRVAQVGPGYNDSAVPGRSTPIRDREDGDYYRWSWNRILESDVSIVLIETWNEMHEGTTICQSVEYGRDYIDLTRSLIDRWKEGQGPAETIELAFPEPRPRPPSDKGKGYANAEQVSIELSEPIAERGIWLVQGQPDGPVESREIDGERYVTSSGASIGYLYFSVADPFLYDADEPVTIEYTYYDDGFDWHMIQYDSHETSATLKGAYTDSIRIPCRNSGEWITRTLELDNARFVNRQNGASDFRFAMGGALSLKRVQVKRSGQGSGSVNSWRIR